MLKITIKDFNVDWKKIKNECRQTINMVDSNIEPNENWKKKLLICRHSPLRIGTILIHIEDVPYYVMGHLVRHNVGVVPFVGTSREDRTNIKREERKQTDLVSMDLFINIESLMNISERRLCNCADVETLKTWKAVIEEIAKYDELLKWASVPQCIRCGGCVEPFSECKFFENFAKNLTKEELINVKTRYDKYNEFREKGLIKK